MGLIRVLWLLLMAQPVLLSLATAPAAAQDVEPDYIPAMIVSEANFRADPSTKNTPLGLYPAGTQLLLLGHTNDETGRQWYLARLYDNGLQGYISAKLVRPLPAFPSPPSDLGATTVTDTAQKAELVGLHALLMKSIGNDPGGEVVVFEDLGLLYLQGYQTNAAGNQLTISGYVTEVGPTSFRLSGSLQYQVPGTSGPMSCSGSNNYTFSLTPDGKAWRLTLSPCGTAPEQVIDIRKRGG